MVTSAVLTGSELAKAETELQMLREQFQDNTPLIKSLEAKVASLRSQFAAVQSGGISPEDRISIPLGTLPEVSMAYLNKLRDIKILEQVNAYLESQRMQEAVQEERDVPTIQIVDAAMVPERRSSPSRFWMVVVGAVVSSILAVFILFAQRVFVSLRTMRQSDAMAD